ncbi:MAG: DUF1292 domain-containing protein [Rhodobacterales bacterium]|nr:DUF1292 domain-containing protein [Rhodobacterales bacterium]
MSENDEQGFDEQGMLDEKELVRIHDGEQEILCAVLAVAEIDGQEYALLGRAEQLTDEDGDLELFIFRYELDEEEVENFTSVETDEAYNRAREFFSTLMEQDDGEEE